MTHVKLVYYRDSGKYYSEGETELPDRVVFQGGINHKIRLAYHEALDAVEEMLNNGHRPGLVDGHDFHVLVTIYTEHGPLSVLMTRRTRGNLDITDHREHPTTFPIGNECSCDGKEPGPMGGGA